MAKTNMPVQEICDTLHIGRSTLYRYAEGNIAKVGVRQAADIYNNQ